MIHCAGNSPWVDTVSSIPPFQGFSDSNVNGAGLCPALLIVPLSGRCRLALASVTEEPGIAADAAALMFSGSQNSFIKRHKFQSREGPQSTARDYVPRVIVADYLADTSPNVDKGIKESARSQFGAEMLQARRT